MNEEEFRKLFRSALGEPPPSDLRSRLEAGLGARRSRRMSFAGPIIATLWLLIVAGFLGWRLYERATSPATVKPTTTAVPTSAVDPSNCRLPVVVMRYSGPPGQMATEVGFVDTRTGQYVKDSAASIADLPGGGFEGTDAKPSQPAAPAHYSATARRWLPVSGGLVAPDGHSYIWVRLLPEGSNFSNFKKSELHRYDLTAATDQTLWSYEGSIDVWRWDASGILVNTVPPTGGSRIWWRIDPLTGMASQQPPSTDPSRLTELPGDRQNGRFAYGGLGKDARGHTIFRIGSRQAGDQEWIFYESAPGQRVTIYKGQQGDATGFDPFRAMWDGTGIWFSDYETRGIWHWQRDTGLRKITVKGLPAPLPGQNSSVYVNPAGQCM